MKQFKIPASVRNKFSQIFGSKPAFIVYAILIALSIWLVVSSNIYPTTAKTIRGVEVTVKLPETSAESGEYQLQEHTVSKVDIKIEANRSQIGNLTAADFEAVVDASSMKEPGTQTFTINIKCSKNITYVVDSISEDTDSVTIDKTESKEVNVSAYAPKIQVEEGYVLDGDVAECTPSTVTITGPSQLLRQIEEARVIVSNSKNINTSYTTYSNKVAFYDENGAEIESDKLKTNTSEFIVNFSVLAQKDLDLVYQLKNAPTDFDEDWFRDKISLSSDVISLAASGTDLDDLETWDFGTVSMNDVGLDFTKSIDVDVPDEYRNISGTSSVTLTLDNSELAEREITINDISVINQPVGYTNFKVATESLTITLVGDKAQIDAITQNDIIANVNLVGYKLQSYAFDYDVTVSFNNFDRVWAYGTYKASVSCEEDNTNSTNDTTETTSE